jgi:4-hydroxy-tetrahydrodipicolinate synthase
MVHNIFKGLGIALITPFQENGSVDYKALIRLVEYQLSNGADFFCILATTGETPTLTAEEKQKIKDLVVDLVGGRVPILMGCGGNNTAAIVEELKTGDFKGIDGVLSVCPYYNKPSQEGLYQHFKAIASATKLPVVLYNVPGRTGVNLKAETTVRLAQDCKNIVAIKEASGKLEQVDEIIKNNINNVAFGANFYPYLEKSKLPVSVYPQEAYSKNIILNNKVIITPSSFNLTPIEEIETK